MHINNPDALKTWLTEVLEPLCDADPGALARYVLALLKKDKPEKDLRDCMKEQLDVFLAHETEPFLERLFRSIKSEDYIKIVQAKEAAAAAAAAAIAVVEAAAAVQQQNTSSIGTAQSQPSATPDDTNNSSSKVRIKREFTPPLHENNSNGKSSKDASAGIVSSGEKSSVASSTNNNNSVVHEIGNELSSSANSGAIPTPAANNNLVSSQNSSNASGKIPIKSSNNKDEHSKESRNRGRRISNRSRSRSRSRSFERSRESRRSRSRDRGPLRGESNRDKANRQYRSNKSPLGRGGESFRNRYDRKNHGYENRRGGGSGGGGNSGGGSSGASGGGASRTVNRSQSGSRSPSPVVDRRKMARSESPVTAAAAAAAASAAVPAPVMDHTPSAEPGPLNAKRQRCRDFDEKGYCMRGETCPWDHGVDPVVLEDINNPALITIQSAAQMRTGPIHPEYSPDAPELWNRPPNFPPGRPSIAQRLGNIAGVPGFGPRGALSGSFRGVAPGFPTGFPGNPIGATPLQRELISVPVVDANKGGDVSAQQPKRRFEPEDAVAVADAHMKRKIPMNNRLGPRVTGHPAGNGGIVNPQHNCSLELRKIPRGLNAIAHLNNHFSKFGKIVNIQISYDGDPEAAIVTFSTHAEANVAYRSTEAVLNNRFIKVFWHSSPVGGDQPAITPGAKTEHSLRRSYPNQYSINNNLNISSAATTPTSAAPTVSKDGTPIAAAITSAATSMASGGENVAPTNTVVATHLTTATKLINTTTTPIVTANQLRMKHAAKINHAKSDLMRKTQEITQGLRKRKYDLLQGYLKELRTLVMMVEKFEAHDSSRAKLLSSIKELEGKIDKLKAEIASDQSQIVAQVAPKRKTKEQHEKEILDAELELIAQEQRTHRVPGSGNAPTPVVVSGAAPVSKPQLYGPQGVRAVRATNRVAPLGSTSVDRRPTTIAITGFSLEDADALLGHFKHFGEITKHQLEETVPSLSITYSIRQNAEKALVRGKMFRDITLQIGWAVINNTNIKNNATPVGAQVVTTESKEKASPVENASEADGLSKVAADTAEKMDEAVGENAGTVVGAETTSSAASMDTLNETASMEETSEVQLVEEEEEEEDMESEDRSWRR